MNPSLVLAATTTAHDWLDQIAAHGPGARTLDTRFHPRSREDREPPVRALGELVTAEGGAA